MYMHMQKSLAPYFSIHPSIHRSNYPCIHPFFHPSIHPSNPPQPSIPASIHSIHSSQTKLTWQSVTKVTAGNVASNRSKLSHSDSSCSVNINFSRVGKTNRKRLSATSVNAFPLRSATIGGSWLSGRRRLSSTSGSVITAWQEINPGRHWHPGVLAQLSAPTSTLWLSRRANAIQKGTNSQNTAMLNGVLM